MNLDQAIAVLSRRRQYLMGLKPNHPAALTGWKDEVDALEKCLEVMNRGRIEELKRTAMEMC